MIKYNQLTNIISRADKNILNLIKDNKKTSEETLFEELRKYNLLDALMCISLLNQFIFRKNGNLKSIRVFSCIDEELNFIYRSDILAKLTHFFIKSGANDYKKKRISLKADANLIVLHNIISNYLEPEIPINEDTLANHICIIIKEQLEPQKSLVSQTARNYLLFKDMYEEKFIKNSGLTFAQYFNTCLCVLANSYAIRPFFKKREILDICNKKPVPFVNKTAIENFLNYLSIDYSGYRNDILKYEKLNIYPLHSKPIIKTGSKENETYMIVNPCFLAEKVFNGLFFDIERTFETNKKFRDEFGRIFESYVGKFLKYEAKNIKIIPEITYRKNHTNAQFVDWIVLENDTAYLIEVKSSTMPLDDVYNSNIDNYINKHIIGAYLQIIKKLNDIKTSKELQFLKDKQVKPIIIFRDVLPFYNELFRKKLIDAIEKMKNIENKNLIKDFLKTNKIFIFSINDFEYFWLNRNNIKIEKLFKVIENDASESIFSVLFKLENFNGENKFLDDIIEEYFPLEKLS